MSDGVLIAGAGPAGCAAAIELRRLGVPVMLVDRARFPRAKVCGCCLGPATLEQLRSLEVDPLALGDALALRWLHLRWGRIEATVALQDSVVASREQLDLRLLRAAAAAGAQVITGTRARIGAAEGSRREVSLRGEHSERLRVSLVIDATGLPRDAGALRARRRGARLGLSQTRAVAHGLPTATVVMAVSRHGYVGLVAFGDGRLNAAASVSAAALQRAGSPAALIDSILSDAGHAPLGWVDGWTGTPPLRHARPIDPGERVLRVGDAAGFWEPFTGEGIGWALRGGRELAEPAARLVERWDGSAALRWRRRQRYRLQRAQLRSRLVAAVTARQRAAPALMGLLAGSPALAGWILPARQGRGALA